MKNFNAFYTIILSLLIVFCFIACNSDLLSGAVNSSPYEIQGTIVDTDGNLLSDVKLYFIYNLIEVSSGSFNKAVNPDSVSYFNQNFPNPFIDATNITFNISSMGSVKLFLTPFNSSDTIKTLVNGTLDEGFYALFVDEELRNNLYACKLRVMFSADSIYQDEIFMLKNNDDPDSLLTEVNPNFEIFNSSFRINYSTVPFGKLIQVTDSSPNILQTKVISRDLTFVLEKPGYNNLIETHSINSGAHTKIIFRMERE